MPTPDPENNKREENKREEFKRWYACGRKVTYYTRGEAKQNVRLLNRKYKSNKKVYRCPYCDWFHGGELHEAKIKRETD